MFTLVQKGDGKKKKILIDINYENYIAQAAGNLSTVSIVVRLKRSVA